MFRSKSSNKNPHIQHKRSSNKFAPSNNVSSTSRSQSKSGSHEFNNSKSSSISSRTSLSSLKESLPENPHIYDLSEIRSATNNFLAKPFSSSSSASSASWKCLIDKKHSIITQRKLRRPIDHSELRKKLSLLCKSHHASLVKLHGASVSGNYIYLVYEFIQGANLSDCLRNKRNPNFTVLSNWVSRVQIIAGIADGLDYMHNCAGFKNGFIHNHIKSSSIVISEEPALVAKICHFGTAQLCGEVPEAINEEDDEDYTVLKRVGSEVGKFVGTRGYMSPEFQATGIPTFKSDVFAFGVVLLEILSGEEPMKVQVDSEKGIFRKVLLIETAREAVESGTGRLRQWVDRRLRDSYPVEVADGLARVALECVQEDPSKRPDMGRVAGWISKYYLESKTWAQSIGLPDEITVSLAPR